jgi:hypothetical protein
MIGKTPFKLVYGKEVVIPMEFILPSLGIAVITDISHSSVVEEILSHLVKLKEDWFVTSFHQLVQKAREKA